MSRKHSINISDPRAHRSRRALQDAAIDLFLQNPTATLSEVASHAGVGRATLYRHFKTREELVLSLATESLEVINSVLDPLEEKHSSASELLAAGLRAIMPVAERFHFLLYLWNISHDDDPAMKIYTEQLAELAELVERAKHEGAIDKSCSTSWAVMMIDNLVSVGWWAVREGDMTSEEAGEHAVRTLFHGLSPRE
ncbi:MAG: TetR/AcrR family transcriptional regulator [Pseudomonadota bacterium]